jgi:molybdenum cofactor guanylyltransferase
LKSAAPIRVGGIVLCGGKSERMGRPKLSLPFGGEVMLSRVVRIAGAVVSPIVVVTGVGQELPALPPGVLVTRDEFSDKGPLAGLAAGFVPLRETVDAVFVSSCDVPLLKPEFIRAIIETIGTHEMAMPCDGQHLHPLAGVYRMSVESRARRLIAENRLSAQLLVENSEARLIDVSELRRIDPSLGSLKNVNTPKEYREALIAAGLGEVFEPS